MIFESMTESVIDVSVDETGKQTISSPFEEIARQEDIISLYAKAFVLHNNI